MSSQIQLFKDGSWIVFAPLPTFTPKLVPGGPTFKVTLSSCAPPGLVECSATGGELMLQGVGEDMPPELEDMIPGYEEFPRGYSIGPVDTLKSISSSEHVKYILERLPQFEKVGWMTSSARRWYVENLRSDNLDAVSSQSDQDLKTEQITAEVRAMLQAIRH